MNQTIDVAAYIWPAYTGKEPRTRLFWPEGIGEWETVKKMSPRYEGHPWPRTPLWGYQDEADPQVMEGQIREALSHGVNVFIYDWYWYDGRPFLEQCLNEGFLGAPNNRDMKFYLMWANHDANYLWDYRNASEDFRSTVIWRGATDEENFRVIGQRWLERYFTLPNYYTLDGKPVLAIYDLNNFINTFGSVEGAIHGMHWLDREARKYGLPGIHFQAVHTGLHRNLSGVDAGVTPEDVFCRMPFDSITNYQFAHMVDVNRSFEQVLPDAEKEWSRLAGRFPYPYFPHVSLGWDNNPRHRSLFKENILKDNTPEAIEAAMCSARDFARERGVPLITVNSWNEWTEGSYLLPDDLYGYGYLDAIRSAVEDHS